MTGQPAGKPFETRGWLSTHKWLFARRLSQGSVLALFMLGPLADLWILKGNLSSSRFLDRIPLTDPLLLLQSLATGHSVGRDAAIGLAVVAALYALAGGRVFCAWVCPMNLVTDGAAWMNRALGLKRGLPISSQIRYWLIAFLLLTAVLTGTIGWAWVNPVSMLPRELIYGMGLAWLLVFGIFFFDTFVSRRGFCGHLCPVGALYSLLGIVALPRVSAARRTACDDCMDCFSVCPEPQVISPALKGRNETSPIIASINCSTCGRCVDVCPRNVFRMTTRFNRKTEDTL